MAGPSEGPAPPPQAFLGLLNATGYRLTRCHMTVLAEHLSRLAGRSSAWSAEYLMNVGRGTTRASATLLSAIDRAALYPPAPPLDATSDYVASRTCACGRLYVPNVPWRTRCYNCNPPTKRNRRM